MRTVVLGLGNPFLGDEGVGVHAVQALQHEYYEDDIDIIDVGTAILDVAPQLERADRVIVIDAVKVNKNPGTVYCIPLGECAQTSCIASMHGFDFAKALGHIRRENLPQIIVIGVEPAYIGWSNDLSFVVTEAMPILLDTVRRQLAACTRNSVENSIS